MREEITDNVLEPSPEKPEDFVGKTFNNGKLTVVGILKRQSKSVLFKVVCTECSKDTELFPLGYFVSSKSDLTSGCIPCGCSKTPKWEPQQNILRVERFVTDRPMKFHGYFGDYKGSKTKLHMECTIHSHIWYPSIDSLIMKGSSCPKCSGVYKPTEQEALEKCKEICDEMNYEVVGFVDGYKNNYSRFEYICKLHGKQNTIYNNFVNNNKRCRGCWKEKQLRIIRDGGNGNGYYPERKDETDFLYVLNFDNKFIKVGRSFDVDERIKGLRTASKVPKKKIYKLRIFTATHQEVYDYEQELHTELRERNFQHYVDWSTECFDNESLPILNKLLDNCKFTQVY